jgi:hypothetical protein
MPLNCTAKMEARDIAQVVEHLPSMHKAMGSISSTKNKKKKWLK